MHFIDLPDNGPNHFPYSQAVRSGDLVFVAGQLASDEPGWAGAIGDIEAETRAAMDRIGRILALGGVDYSNIVRVGIFMTDLGCSDRMNAVYRGYFTGERLPARTCVGVAELLSGGMIEIDCIARIAHGVPQGEV